jgi:hypothetical protein
MDAMSDAIEGADVMLYGVSLRYKESANCRMVRAGSTSKHAQLGPAHTPTAQLSNFQ